jgi:hypothetical protein
MLNNYVPVRRVCVLWDYIFQYGLIGKCSKSSAKLVNTIDCLEPSFRAYAVLHSWYCVT